MVSFKSPFPPAEPPGEGERGRESGPPGRPTRRRSPGGPVRPFPRAGVFPSCPPPFPRPAVSHSSYPALWWAGSGAPSADAANGGAFGRRKTNGDGDGGGGKGDWAGLRLEAGGDGARPADGGHVAGGEESHRRTLPVIDVRPRPPIAKGIE